MNITELEGLNFDTFEEFKAYVEGGDTTPKEKRIKTIGIAYPAFEHAFRRYFPTLRNIRTENDVKECDLIVFSGGEDISPRIYGQRDNYCYGINPHRDEIEIQVYNWAQKLKKKMLGVCRGHQLIAALNGGSLYQDFVIEGQGDIAPHGSDHVLEIKSANSIVGRFFEGQRVTSYHHQAINVCPPGMRITSMYKNVIESTETRNIITVQFHPEFQSDPNTVAFMKYIEEEW